MSAKIRHIMSFVITTSFLGASLLSCMPAAAPEVPTEQTERIVKPSQKGIEVALPDPLPVASSDFLAPSVNPPGGLSPEQVPQFVNLGFDDNGVSDNINWLVEEFKKRRNPAGKGKKETFDGTPALVSFYVLGSHGDGMIAWKNAFDAGHELGIHTYNHPHGVVSTGEGTKATIPWKGWQAEIQKTFISLEKLGIPRSQVRGYRQPYLEYSMHSLVAAVKEGLQYDCSIEEFALEENIFQHYWPYTLDAGSPGNAQTANGQQLITSLKGFWELPVYYMDIPTLDQAEKYGLLDAEGKPYDLAEKCGASTITGFDYNLWTLYKFTGKEFAATLKYNLDLRLAGNRAPLTFGTHSDDYPADPAVVYRREALMEFVDYALSKPEVRLVRGDQIIGWMKAPVAF